MIAEAFDGLAGEKSVRAGHGRFVATFLLEFVEQLDDGSAGGDLVVEDDRGSASHITDDRIDHDLVIGLTLLAARSDWYSKQPCEQGRSLGVAEIGRHDHGVAQVAAPVVIGQLTDRGEVVDRHAEKTVHLGCVQRHGHDPVGSSRGQHVSDETAANRDPRRVLFVRACVRVMRNDRSD